MPVFQMESAPPVWCEMRFFEVVELEPGAKHTFVRHSPKEKLIVGEGSCTITNAGENAAATVGTNLDLKGGTDSFIVTETHMPTTLIRMAGAWGDEVGGSGLFSVQQSAQPHNSGDLVDYAKETNFDCHYHDCDEYWIIYSGSGSVVSEGKHYQVKRGDCIATGMGHHHDFPLVTGHVKAVYFETTLEGAKRLGHLWDHTHGIAQPKPDRV